jgi:hypothetical protein
MVPGAPSVTVTTGIKNIPVPITVATVATEIDPFFDDPGAGFALFLHQCPSGPHIATVTATAYELWLGGVATLDFQFEIILDP